MRQRPPKLLGYVGLYLAFGLMWIHGSDAAAALYFQDADAFALISRLKGSLFIVVTGLFLYVALLRVRRASASSAVPTRNTDPIVLAGMLALVLVTPFVGGTVSHYLADTFALSQGLGLLLAGIGSLALAALLLVAYRQQLKQVLNRSISHDMALREDLLAHFFNLPFVGMALVDPVTGRWLRVNEQLQQMLGYPPEELYRMNLQQLTCPDDLGEDEAAFSRLMVGEIDDYQLEKRFVKASGELLPVRICVRVVRDGLGQAEYVVGMVLDLSRDQHQQMLLQRESGLYSMLSQINQLILYSKSESEVLQSACNIAVTLDSLQFAWVGGCNEQRHLCQPLAYAGSSNAEQGFEELFEIFARHPGRGLSEKAVVEGRTVVDNDSMNAPEYKPWLPFIQRFQCRSAIALPIRKNGQVYANLTLYSDEEGFFSERLVNTLEEMVCDIGFALDSISRDLALQAANQVINSSPFVLLRWRNTPGWPVTFVSENIRRWGLSPDAFLKQCGAFERIIHEEDRHRTAQEVEAFLARGLDEYDQRYRIRLPDGRIRWVEDRTHVLRDDARQVMGMEGVLVDVTERQQQESRLRQAAAVVQSTREGVLVTDARHHIVQVNPAFSDMFGWHEVDLLDKTPVVLRSGRHSTAFYRDLRDMIEQEGYWQGEILSRRRDGEIFPTLLSISRVTDDYGEVTHFVGVYTDLTRLKNSESRIEFLSNYDALTELPNRQLLFQKLTSCIQYNRRHSRLSALLMADLDNFKDINDSFGHLEGDKLLVDVVNRFRARVRDEDSLYRLGGDEFAILLEDIDSSERAAAVADELMRQLTPVFVLTDGTEIRTSASVGISLIDGSITAPEALLQQADAALFKAKEQRGSLSFYSDDLTISARHRLNLEQRLRYALEHDELCLFYQPQWDVSSGAMTGVEALIRWNDPEDGMVPPGVFIPVAEQSNLIGLIGRWVVRQACHQLAEWRARGLEVPRVAINVSPQQLHYHDLITIVAEALEETGIPPGLLEVELTEGVLMSSAIQPEALLQQLRELGVRLAIDDFGTGYSSLAYLKRFPLDLLKIDKSFTDDLLTSREAQAVVETIIVLGHKLGLTVLAEGVEKVEQLDELARLGCHQYQGYLSSKPLQVSELEQLMASSSVEA